MKRRAVFGACGLITTGSCLERFVPRARDRHPGVYGLRSRDRGLREGLCRSRAARGRVHPVKQRACESRANSSSGRARATRRFSRKPPTLGDGDAPGHDRQRATTAWRRVYSRREHQCLSRGRHLQRGVACDRRGDRGRRHRRQHNDCPEPPVVSTLSCPHRLSSVWSW